jgi:GNAT superfamily N-acetyltransferase
MGYEPNAEKKMFDKPIPLLQLVKQGLAEDVGQPTFHVSSHDDFKTAFEVEMVIDNNNPGFFSYQYFPETDDVENDVYIHSDQYRGQGFGKLLLLKAIETAQQHGLPFKPDRNGISPEQRRVYQSLLNDRLINIAPDRTITLRGKQGLAEGSLNEYRDRMYQYLKSIVPRFPDYVVKDWLYANFARGATQGPGWSFATIGKDILRILADMGLSVNTKWQLVPDMKFTMNMWEPKTLKRLQARAGGSSKSADPDVHIPARDAERHATQAQLAQQQGGVRKEPVILIKTAKGYELLEGWHRTIQHFAKYPDGYIGPAYVAVAQGQQGVAEGIGHNVDDLSDVADWMRTTPDKLKMVVKQEPIEKFIKQIREMYGTYDEFPEDEERTNRILKLLKKGSKPLPIYVEDGDPDLFVMEGRHRMVAFWLAGMKTIPVAYVSVKKQGVAENFADGKNPQDKGDSRRHGVPTKASVSTLRKVAKQGGRKGQLAHWMANMKAGKAKKK